MQTRRTRNIKKERYAEKIKASDQTGKKFPRREGGKNPYVNRKEAQNTGRVELNRMKRILEARGPGR